MKHQDRIFNTKQHSELRKALRDNMPEPEKKLWQLLRKKKLGVKFRRQHGIGRYITDFYCPECKLVVELDGDSHFTSGARNYDAERNTFMIALGLRVLRFNNNDVMTNIDSVLEKIINQVQKQTPP
jgi:very-short-patch-repair endonuclease